MSQTRTILPFTEEQSRILVNVEQHYDVWIQAERKLAELPYGMKWKTISGKEYLYEVRDRIGNGRSLGPRSPDTDRIHSEYVLSKKVAGDVSTRAGETLRETCDLYRSLRLPLVASEAARILREADRRSMLGSHLFVVGTNALPAYAIEAGGRILGLSDETDDFDMAWRGRAQEIGDRPVMSMLKAVDSTYTLNTEREFQMRNAKAHEFELLVAPSQVDGIARTDIPRPIPLPEQEWLLEGRQVSRVVVARDGSPARIVAPDPRWFAVQKLWLSTKPERAATKKPKDLAQGTRILEVVAETMRHLPLDGRFEETLPAELVPVFREWRDAHPVVAPARPSW